MSTHANGADNFGHDVPLGRLHHVQILAQDQKYGGDSHERRRNTEREGVTGVVSKALDILAENGSEECGDQWACWFQH